MAVSFSNDGSDAMKRKLYLDDKWFDSSNSCDLMDMFEIDRCVAWANLQCRSADQVLTLQFPDCLLRFAAPVASLIEQRLHRPVDILGDTSYGDCCVDEVAARKIQATGLIHFGNTCLSPTSSLAVLHIFTRLPFDMDMFTTTLKEAFPDPEEKVAVVYDVRYHWALKSWPNEWPNLFLCVPASSDESEANAATTRLGRICPPDMVSRQIVYVGNNAQFAQLLALTFPSSKHSQFDPKSNQLQPAHLHIQRSLMKRYYLVEKTKDANRIGILVGTMSVRRYKSIIEHLKTVIKRSGRKVYTFLVGKPNVAKLANFSEIDVFVIVACPENSIVDATDFLCPIITPFELELALNANRPWTGDQYVADFVDLLSPDGPSYVPYAPHQGDDVSLISGKIRSGQCCKEKDDPCAALATQETTLARLHINGGGEVLASRSWTGLEQKLGQTEVLEAVEGRPGIASGYAGEGGA